MQLVLLSAAGYRIRVGRCYSIQRCLDMAWTGGELCVAAELLERRQRFGLNVLQGSLLNADCSSLYNAPLGGPPHLCDNLSAAL